jgi:branched-chain amino acid transport system substrate-binding protein
VLPSPRRRALLTGLALAPLAARATPPAAKTATIIGAALPLTGALALVGDEALRGLRLAAAAQNAAGGIGGAPVQLAVGDIVDQGHAAATVNALIKTSQARVILGAGSSDFCYPASAAAELAQIPYVELTAPADGITARGFKFLVRTGPTTKMIAALASATLRQRFAGRKLGLLFNTGATGGAIAAALLADPPAGGTALAIGYPPDGTDLYDAIGRLKRAGVEVLVHAAGPEDVLAAWTAMAETGWWPHGVIGAGDGYLLRETAIAVGAGFEAALVIGPPGAPTEAAPVEAAYLATYGMKPRGPESLAAYAGALLTFQTLDGLGGATAALPAALRATALPPGGLANGWGARFDAAGQNLASFVQVQTWRQGRLVAA